LAQDAERRSRPLVNATILYQNHRIEVLGSSGQIFKQDAGRIRLQRGKFKTAFRIAGYYKLYKAIAQIAQAIKKYYRRFGFHKHLFYWVFTVRHQSRYRE
jgi:hypothetical protein